MKKLMISMPVLALFFASCGDASTEASSESNNDDNTVESSESVDPEIKSNDANTLCDCLTAAKSEDEAQACDPSKGIDELSEIMMTDCMSGAIEDVQDAMDDAMEDAKGAMGDAMEDAEGAMEDAKKAMEDAMKGM
jgi:hypothetical protein